MTNILKKDYNELNPSVSNQLVINSHEQHITHYIHIVDYDVKQLINNFGFSCRLR